MCQRRTFIIALSESAIVVALDRTVKVIHDDPADNRVLEAAVSTQVNYIVSGDQDFLDLRSYGGVQIVAPARFAAVLTTLH